MQYIKFVTATSADTLPSSASTMSTVKTSVQSSPTNIVLSELKPATATGGATIAPKPLKSIAAKTPVTTGQVVMLPSYVQSQLNTKVPIPMRHTPVAKQVSPDSSLTMTPEANLESNGMRPRKPCNCTKSQCLKLYCDCFANGEFCYMCNCMNCFNNLENEGPPAEGDQDVSGEEPERLQAEDRQGEGRDGGQLGQEAHERVQLQEVRLSEELLRVLRGEDRVFEQLQMRGVPEHRGFDGEEGLEEHDRRRLPSADAREDGAGEGRGAVQAEEDVEQQTGHQLHHG
jgi:hypothetical protein